MKTQLLASVLGVALLAGSGLALADRGRADDHSRGPSHERRYDGDRYGHDRGRHYGPPPHAYAHRHGHGWHGRHWHRPGWRHPYHTHYQPAPKHYGRYDDGVTIIFKGRID